MKYSINARSFYKSSAKATIKDTEIIFGITSESSKTLANPAELFLSAFSACILKNVERFSNLMNFDYTSAEIEISATRFEKPPRMDEIIYKLTIYSNDNGLNINLLKKNIEKFGTIYNTVQSSCSINGEINKIPE